jgi:protease IV
LLQFEIIQENKMPDPRQTTPPPPPYYYHQPRKSRWWIPVLIIGLFLLFFVIAIVVFAGLVGSAFDKKTVEVKANTVLNLNYGSNVVEYSPTAPFSIFGDKKKSTFYDIITAIKRAKNDDKIKGILIESSTVSMGFAKASEIQQTLDDFKESGKFVYAYLSYASEKDYYNALPANKIFIEEEGLAELNGFSSSNLFMKDFLKMIGVEMYVEKYEDFKSAGESLSRTGYSDSARHQTRILLNGFMDTFTDAIVKYRDIDKPTLMSCLNRGIYTPDSLLAFNLVDQIATKQELLEIIKKEMFGEESEDKEINLVSSGNYMASDPPINAEIASRDQQLAIIYGVGTIVMQSDDSPFSDEVVITPKDFIKHLKAAREDDNIKAIIIRIDSPGGSALASDMIYKELLKTKEVKPVYASMSDLAASGGYYIPIGCDTIIASPNTITGSIGVITVIPNLSGLIGKLEMRPDTINTTAASQFMNGMYPYSESDKEKLRGFVGGMYDRFVAKVAKSRNMDFEQARSLAKGRVWLGSDAKEIGLVDVLGGFQDAIAIAKKRMGVPEDHLVYTQVFPKPVDEFQALLRMFGMDDTEENIDMTFDIAKSMRLSTSNWAAAYEAMPEEIKSEFDYFMTMLYMSKNENAFFMMPNLINVQ